VFSKTSEPQSDLWLTGHLKQLGDATSLLEGQPVVHLDPQRAAQGLDCTIRNTPLMQVPCTDSNQRRAGQTNSCTNRQRQAHQHRLPMLSGHHQAKAIDLTNDAATPLAPRPTPAPASDPDRICMPSRVHKPARITATYTGQTTSYFQSSLPIIWFARRSQSLMCKVFATMR
jgi:hypothetical protein